MQWILDGKFEYTYDESGNNTSQISSYLDEISGQWLFSWKNSFYYSGHEILPEIPEARIFVYPNPASEYILFDLGYLSEPVIVEIYDNQGKKVLEHDLYENRQISVSNMAKGLYLFRLNYNGKLSTGKIILE